MLYSIELAIYVFFYIHVHSRLSVLVLAACQLPPYTPLSRVNPIWHLGRHCAIQHRYKL